MTYFFCLNFPLNYFSLNNFTLEICCWSVVNAKQHIQHVGLDAIHGIDMFCQGACSTSYHLFPIRIMRASADGCAMGSLVYGRRREQVHGWHLDPNKGFVFWPFSDRRQA